jgi:hypothetical protein
MNCEIEFFRMTEASPEGATIRRFTGEFESLEDAEKYSLKNAGAEVDGFRIYIAGHPRKAIYIRPKRREA